jgi:List-Bact-rpt repeat protein/type IX secretion system substrate protein
MKFRKILPILLFTLFTLNNLLAQNSNIKASVDPLLSGTITGTGIYVNGTLATLDAVSDIGYTFVNWTEEDIEVSQDSNYSFIVLAPRTLVANFTLKTYTISTSSIPLNGGITSGGGTFDHGNVVDLEAIPATGYTFENWTESDIVVSTDSAYPFNAESDRDLVANFSLNNYIIVAISNPVEGGIISGTGAFDHGDQVELIATPETEYTFENWTESDIAVSSDSAYSFNAESDRDLVANFSLNNYLITTISNPFEGGITNGGGSFDHGDVVDILATPETGYTFENWTESDIVVSSDSAYSFNAESDRDLIANFSLNNYLITTISNPFEGGVTNGGGSFDHGDVVDILATPETGYTFVNWTESGLEVSSDSAYSFNADSDRDLIANFSFNNYLIAAISNPVEGGIITGTGAFDHGDPVELIATPVEGYYFLNWTENDLEVSTDSLYSFPATISRSLIANFGIFKYSVTTTVIPSEGGITVGDNTYDHGTLVEMTATPNEGWNFDSWNDGDDIVWNDSIYTFIVMKETNLSAHFSKIIYNINTVSEPIEGGTITGGGNYPYDSLATIVATPNVGWNFMNWTEDDVVVYSDSLIEFNVKVNRNLIAQFEKKVYPISSTPSPIDGGETFGDSIYTHGNEVKLIAVAQSDSGWDFINWTENSIEVSTDSIYSFVATDERSLVANFQLRSYSVELLINPNEAGSISGNGNYTHGTEVTIVATESAGWIFANWTENEVNISSEDTSKFIIRENRIITANFAHNLYSVVASPMPIEAGIISGAGSFFYGQTASLTALPNVGWDFRNWSINNVIVSTSSTYEFDVIDNVNLKVNFAQSTFLVNCTVFPETAGYTSGCGLSYYNKEMSIAAIANEGWEFDCWTEDGIEVSTEPDYLFTVLNDKKLVAIFDELTAVESLDDNSIMPTEYYISNPYPNPFNPETNVNFGLPEPSEVNINIFDVNGRLVRTVLDNTSLPAGNYRNNFDGSDVSSGIYFYHIFAQSVLSDQYFKKVGKLILLK